MGGSSRNLSGGKPPGKASLAAHCGGGPAPLGRLGARYDRHVTLGRRGSRIAASRAEYNKLVRAAEKTDFPRLIRETATSVKAPLLERQDFCAEPGSRQFAAEMARGVRAALSKNPFGEDPLERWATAAYIAKEISRVRLESYSGKRPSGSPGMFGEFHVMRAAIPAVAIQIIRELTFWPNEASECKSTVMAEDFGLAAAGFKRAAMAALSGIVRISARLRLESCFGSNEVDVVSDYFGVKADLERPDIISAFLNAAAVELAIPPDNRGEGKFLATEEFYTIFYSTLIPVEEPLEEEMARLAILKCIREGRMHRAHLITEQFFAQRDPALSLGPVLSYVV